MIEPLIYNNDIKSLSEKSSITPEIAVLLRYENALETKIQSHGRNCFVHLKQEISFQYPDAKLEFIQLDNGANLTQTGKFKKWREGTVSRFTDFVILASLASSELGDLC